MLLVRSKDIPTTRGYSNPANLAEVDALRKSLEIAEGIIDVAKELSRIDGDCRCTAVDDANAMNNLNAVLRTAGEIE